MQTEYLDARASASLLLRPRMGIVVPKYRRTAVERNKVKRRLRELGRTVLLPVAEHTDIVLRARPSAYDAAYAALRNDFSIIVEWITSRRQSE